MAKLLVNYQKNRDLCFGLSSEKATLISLIISGYWKVSCSNQRQPGILTNYFVMYNQIQNGFWVELILLRF